MKHTGLQGSGLALRAGPVTDSSVSVIDMLHVLKKNGVTNDTEMSETGS